MQIRSRSQWGARYANGAGSAPLPATGGVALHHSVTAARNGDAAVRDLEDIGQGRFGAGISYTFLITPDGTVYEGHSVDRLGAHTGGHNSTVRAICLIGNYDEVAPTAAQIGSAAHLLAHGVRQGWWPLRLRGHRDFKSTACPGAKAYAAIPTIVARARQILDGASTPPPKEFTVDAEAKRRFDAIDKRLNELAAGIMLDEASDDKEAALDVRRHGSLRGWVAAIAEKVGATRERAVELDPTHKD